jgi:vacuolar-type H+-ATPase subunit H
MNATEQINFDSLEQLLQKQIEMAETGNYKAVEKFAIEADCEIKKILTNKPTQIPDFENKRKNILKMYKKLELMLSAEKENVKGQQKTVDNVRKTLSAYQTNG